MLLASVWLSQVHMAAWLKLPSLDLQIKRPGIMLCLHPADWGWRYIVASPSLAGCMHIMIPIKPLQYVTGVWFYIKLNIVCIWLSNMKNCIRFYSILLNAQCWLTGAGSVLVLMMVWCRQATSHGLDQCLHENIILKLLGHFMHNMT